MVDKVLPSSECSADEKLASAVSRSLDKSLDDIDEVSVQRLHNMRVQALNYSKKSPHKWGALSMAASVAALLLIPFAHHQYSLTAALDSELDVVLQEIPYSAEELDDMDMLMSLEDPDV